MHPHFSDRGEPNRGSRAQRHDAGFLDEMLARKQELEAPRTVLQSEISVRTLAVVHDLVAAKRQAHPERDMPPAVIARKEETSTWGRIMGRADLYPDEILYVTKPEILRYFPRAEHAQAEEALDALRAAGLVEKVSWYDLGFAEIGEMRSLDPDYKPSVVGYFPTELGIGCRRT